MSEKSKKDQTFEQKYMFGARMKFFHLVGGDNDKKSKGVKKS